ncbi:MAG: sodium:phosphate symporter, partial [Halobaculum sp.]
MSRGRVGGIVFAVAITLRATQLWRSPLPFNPDGIIYARRAATVLTTGQLPLAAMATDEYLFTALTATLGIVTGHAPMTVLQP